MKNNELRNEIEKYTKKINEIEENQKKLDEINKKFKEITKNLSYEDLKKEEIKQKLDNLNEKEKELINNIKLLEIEKNLISNNVVYLFIQKYNKGIIEILKKYENKNIGEKTSEKIEEEIKDYLTDLEVEYIYFRLNKNNYDSEYNLGDLTIKTKNIGIKYYFKKYRNYGREIEYNYYDICNYYGYNEERNLYCSSKDMIFQNYEYIEDTKKQATYIYNLNKKQKAKFEKLKEEMKEIRNNLDEEISKLKLNNSISKNLEIDYQVNLY